MIPGDPMRDAYVIEQQKRELVNKKEDISLSKSQLKWFAIGIGVLVVVVGVGILVSSLSAG